MNKNEVVKFEDVQLTPKFKDSVSFSVKRGSIHAIVGEKESTDSLIKYMSGSEVPQNGTVYLRGNKSFVGTKIFGILNGLAIANPNLQYQGNETVVSKIQNENAMLLKRNASVVNSFKKTYRKITKDFMYAARKNKARLVAPGFVDDFVNLAYQNYAKYVVNNFQFIDPNSITVVKDKKLAKLLKKIDKAETEWKINRDNLDQAIIDVEKKSEEVLLIQNEIKNFIVEIENTELQSKINDYLAKHGDLMDEAISETLKNYKSLLPDQRKFLKLNHDRVVVLKKNISLLNKSIDEYKMQDDELLAFAKKSKDKLYNSPKYSEIKEDIRAAREISNYNFRAKFEKYLDDVSVSLQELKHGLEHTVSLLLNNNIKKKSVYEQGIMSQIMTLDFRNRCLNLFKKNSIPKALHKTWLKQRIDFLSDRYNFDVKSVSKVANLSVNQKINVEIIKLLILEVDLFVFYDSTKELNYHETEEFLRILKLLQAEGKTIILVSSMYDEILAIASEVTLLNRRDESQTIDTTEFTVDKYLDALNLKHNSRHQE